MLNQKDKIYGILVLLFGILCDGYTLHDSFCKNSNAPLRRYDSNSKLCCDGELHPLENKHGEKKKCCPGMGAYVPGKQVCCGPNLVNNDTLYKRYKQPFCCNGEFHERTNEYNDCCTQPDDTNGNPYNKAAMICCRGTLSVRKPGVRMLCWNDESYVSDFQQCLNGKVTRKSVCKGVTEYDIRDEICCSKSGTVLKRPVVNVHPLEVEPNYACENDRLYDKNKVQILDDKPIPVGATHCGGETYFNKPGAEVQSLCCNNTRRMVRHQDGVVPACCRADLYDNATQSCCNGQILPLGQKCCKRVKYNTSTSVCCRGTVISKRTQICCRTPLGYSQIMNKGPGAQNHTACCGNQTYNEFDQECVENMLSTNLVEEIRSKIEDIGGQLGPPPNVTRAYTNISSFNKDHVSNTTVVDVTNPPCLFGSCGMVATDVDSHTPCKKENGILVFVYGLKETPNGTRMKAIVLKGLKTTIGRKITLKTSSHCTCFKLFKQYWLYTNKRTKRRDRKIVTISGNDDVFVRKSSSLKCDVTG